jgi:hypothetical protein
VLGEPVRLVPNIHQEPQGGRGFLDFHLVRPRSRPPVERLLALRQRKEMRPRLPHRFQLLRHARDLADSPVDEVEVGEDLLLAREALEPSAGHLPEAGEIVDALDGRDAEPAVARLEGRAVDERDERSHGLAALEVGDVHLDGRMAPPPRRRELGEPVLRVDRRDVALDVIEFRAVALEGLDGLELVAESRRALELELLRRVLHAGGEVFFQLRPVAAQELAERRDVRRVVLLRDSFGARRGAAVDGVQEARPEKSPLRIVRAHFDLARRELIFGAP